MVMEGLKELDDVAYVRFASVHREFKDINILLNEIENLVKDKKKNDKSFFRRTLFYFIGHCDAEPATFEFCGFAHVFCPF